MSKDKKALKREQKINARMEELNWIIEDSENHLENLKIETRETKSALKCARKEWNALEIELLELFD